MIVIVGLAKASSKTTSKRTFLIFSTELIGSDATFSSDQVNQQFNGLVRCSRSTTHEIPYIVLANNMEELSEDRYRYRQRYILPSSGYVPGVAHQRTSPPTSSRNTYERKYTSSFMKQTSV
jgi:hypothetical protein